MKRAIDYSTVRQMSNSTRDDLYARHISEALDKLSVLVQYSQDSLIRADFEELRANYTAMLSFLVQDGRDSNRFAQQREIARKTWALLTRTRRAMRLLSCDDAYTRTAARLAREQADVLSVMRQWTHTPPSEERYALQDTLFDLLWTSPLWSSEDTALWHDFILRQDTMVQQHLLGGVFLAMWEFPDPEKMRFTLLMAKSEDRRTRLTALTAMTLVLQTDGHELESLTDCQPCALASSLLPMAISVQMEQALVLASVIDTERELDEISHIPHDNVAQAIRAALKIKLKYVRKRLALGYDPNLSRLSTLHSCKFLDTCSHWFLPFDSTHPLAQSLAVGTDGTENKALHKMTQVSADCDIDKYAMCELISNNKGLAQSMSDHLEQSGISPKEAELPDLTLRHIVQDLYRFFTQSPVHQDVRNPFANLHLLIEQERFRPADAEEECLNCVDTLLEASEHKTAARILDSMAAQYGESARMLKLRGRCHEEKRDYQKAYRCYTQATFLEDPDLELCLCLQRCCERLGKRQELHEWLDRIIEIEPSNTTYLSLKAASLEQDGKWADAARLYYKLVYDDSTDKASTESVVRCELMQGNLEQAQKYLEKRTEMAGGTEWPTYLLSAHLCFIQGSWKKAKSFYIAAAEGYIKDKQSTYADFLSKFMSEKKVLLANNISENDLNLMRDILWMSFIHGL